MVVLQEACTLFGIDGEGTRANLISRIVDYLRRFSENKTNTHFLPKNINAPKTPNTPKSFVSYNEAKVTKKRKIVEKVDDSGSDDSRKKMVTNRNVTSEYIFLKNDDDVKQNISNDSDNDDEDDDNFEIMLSNATLEE